MSRTKPLAGLKVIEVASYIPVPVCTKMLLDLGATVYKVERPGGDPMRHMEPRTPDGSANPMFLAFNAGKQCIELDLKTAEGAAALRELVQTADVLVDGFRPGVMTRLALGPDQLRHLNPHLIYCMLSGYGDDSPLREVAGHDLNYIALSGILSMTRAEGVPAMPGTQFADMVSGLTALAAILAALYERARSGQGAVLDIAMSDAALWLASPWLATLISGQPVSPERGNTLTGSMACYRLYATADGRHLAVAALEPHFWQRFCEAIGRPELSDLHLQPEAQLRLIAEVGAVIAARPLDYWAGIFANVDACVTPVLTMAEAAALEQNRARGLVADEPTLPQVLRIKA